MTKRELELEVEKLKKLYPELDLRLSDYLKI